MILPLLLKSFLGGKAVRILVKRPKEGGGVKKVVLEFTPVILTAADKKCHCFRCKAVLSIGSPGYVVQIPNTKRTKRGGKIWQFWTCPQDFFDLKYALYWVLLQTGAEFTVEDGLTGVASLLVEAGILTLWGKKANSV